MIRVKADFTIYNGYESTAAGDTAHVSGEQARKVVIKGGNVVDKAGKPLPLIDQVRLLRFDVDHLIGHSGERVDQINAAIAVVQEQEETTDAPA